jgi:hypothetical protein
MSNPELLLFGVKTKCLCCLEVNTDQSPPEGVFDQLGEARVEWKRRNPSLPLSDSFQVRAGTKLEGKSARPCLTVGLFF